jgi:hypothetical protein
LSLLCTLVPLAILCSEPKIPDDLVVFNGKSPFEAVDGHRLLAIPRVAFSIQLYAGADGLDFITGLDAGSTIELRDGALIAGLCEKENCENANAAIAVARDGGLVALCTYAKDDDHGADPGLVHWVGPFMNRTIAYTPQQTCPQDADSFLDRYASMRQ